MFLHLYGIAVVYEENLFGTSPSRGEVNMQNKKSMHFMLVLFKFLWNMSNNTVLKSWRETNVCYRYKCQDLCCWGYCFLFYVDREENRVLDHVSMNIFDSYLIRKFFFFLFEIKNVKYFKRYLLVCVWTFWYESCIIGLKWMNKDMKHIVMIYVVEQSPNTLHETLLNSCSLDINQAN